MEVLKMSDYILTYSKIKFYPLEPVKENINIEDIAHALSLITRANGHFKHFYSVAQHSINCYKEAQSRGYSTKVQLGCLLHDASESYISDITRPVKKNLPEYFVIEEKLQRTIYEKFEIGDLSAEEQKQIKDIDDALLYFEFKEVMDIDIFEAAPVKTMEHDFSQRDFIEVEQEFIVIFKGLVGRNGIQDIGNIH
jgi:5'-deoxynucleotidase YfbR-like HD superfamily hydrolase